MGRQMLLQILLWTQGHAIHRNINICGALNLSVWAANLTDELSLKHVLQNKTEYQRENRKKYIE